MKDARRAIRGSRAGELDYVRTFVAALGFKGELLVDVRRELKVPDSCALSSG
jgi:hypothetical protein